MQNSHLFDAEQKQRIFRTTQENNKLIGTNHMGKKVYRMHVAHNTNANRWRIEMNFMGYSTENLFTQLSYRFRIRIQNRKITNLRKKWMPASGNEIYVFEFHILTVRRTHLITIANAMHNVCACVLNGVLVLSAYCFE